MTQSGQKHVIQKSLQQAPLMFLYFLNPVFKLTSTRWCLHQVTGLSTTELTVSIWKLSWMPFLTVLNKATRKDMFQTNKVHRTHRFYQQLRQQYNTDRNRILGNLGGDYSLEWKMWFRAYSMVHTECNWSLDGSICYRESLNCTTCATVIANQRVFEVRSTFTSSVCLLDMIVKTNSPVQTV